MNVSIEDPSKRYTGPRNSQAAYSYPPEDNSGRTPFQNSPSLPSMLALLSRPEHTEPEPHHQQHTPAPRSFQPHYQETKHPLYLSEMNPSAPVHYIHHAPQEIAHIPRYQAEPISVPIQPAQNMLPARPERVPIPQLAQRRQSKKISQRRGELQNDYEEINIYSVPEQGLSNEPDRSRPQRPSPLAEKQGESKPFQPSTQRTTSPRSAKPASAPFSILSVASPSDQKPYESRYTLTVRQQPLAARACGFGERDRRVIDPPPILQLHIEDPTATPEEITARLRINSMVVHCTLWDPFADADASAMPGSTDKRQQRRLMGTLVSSPFVGNDEFNVEGCFFTFPDLSVRTPGKYSLRFGLVVLDVTAMQPGHSAPVRAVVKSEPFEVFNAKDFGGMRASTELTKRLKYQGCLISVKKGNNKNNNSRDEDDDDEMQDGNGEDDMTRPSKRSKRR